MIHRIFAVVLYALALAAVAAAAYQFWLVYPMSIGPGGAGPFMLLVAAGLLTALGNLAWRNGGQR